MINLRIDSRYADAFLDEEDLHFLQKDIHYHHQVLLGKKGPGSDYLGWMYLPVETDDSLISRIEEEAGRLRSLADIVVVVGIGGSYLGARAVTEALKPQFPKVSDPGPELVYAGQNISSDYLSDLLAYLAERSFALIVISKSGTTTEPAIAFRLLKSLLERRYGKAGARERILAVTDASRGALKSLADREGYPSFVIADDIGGRFSVLSPVGLLPIAVAGFSIRTLLAGAKEMQQVAVASPLFDENPAAFYAAIRNLLYRRGKPIEVLVNYEPALVYLTEWWKQLFGESEGKQQRGIFPAGVSFTTDLHSLGQYLQDGLRVLFETVITVGKPHSALEIPFEEEDLDGLNYLAGKTLDQVNHMAELATTLAHVDGGVPVVRLAIPALDERSIGELIYFFEFACALSGYVLEVNPFDQPGVEAYKRNMFALLGKEGFEEEAKVLKKRLNIL